MAHRNTETYYKRFPGLHAREPDTVLHRLGRRERSGRQRI